jgi:acetyltransferase
MGNVSMREKLFLYPNPDFNHLPPGNIGGVFQSGGSLQHWSRFGAERGLRFSYLVSSGNELNLDAADYLNFLVEDPETHMIVMFLEGIRRPEAFKEAARRALEAGKPILAVKAGRTEASRQAAQSHTGAIAGDYDVFRALCERYGIVLCANLDDMIETAMAFQGGRLPKGDGMAFITNSGGVVDLLLDHAAAEGANLPAFGKATAAAIRRIVGPDMPIRNPMDCGQAGFASQDNYMAVCAAVAADPRVNMVLFEARTPNREGERMPEPLKLFSTETMLPIFAFNRMRYTVNEVGRAYQDASGIPHLQAMPESVRAMKALGFYAARVGRRIAPLPRPRGRQTDTSGAALEKALKAAGLQAPRSALARTPAEAAAAAKRIGFPVAIKIVSPAISHKTEVGGVKLNLGTAAEVKAEAETLLRAMRRAAPKAEIGGVLVQEMVRGVEMILGVRDDPLYGPVMVAGAGGVLVELVKDTAFRLLPVAAKDARAMIGELAAAKLLAGFRGAAPADIDALSRAICGLSKFYLDHRPWLADLEINPLIVLPRGKGVRAVDIRAVARRNQ